MCDEDLLVRVASGDERAFETLYGRHAAAVRAFVRVRVPDAGTAEEVCADVWLGCWRSARAFRGDAKVLSWLLGIAKRQIYMRVRRVRPNVTALDDAPEPRDDGPSPETAVLSEAGVDDLMALLRRLPVELVETATLAWLHGLSVPADRRFVGRAGRHGQIPYLACAPSAARATRPLKRCGWKGTVNPDDRSS